MPATFQRFLPLFVQKHWGWTTKVAFIFACTLIPVSAIPGVLPSQAAGWVVILGVGVILFDAFAQHTENTLLGARNPGVLRGWTLLIRAIVTVIALELLAYAMYDWSYHHVLVTHPEWKPEFIPFKEWFVGLLELKVFFAGLFVVVGGIVHVALWLEPHYHQWSHRKHPSEP